MKATLNIDDAIMAELKCEAARQGRTMSELVEIALHVCSPLNESGGESPPYQSSAAAEHSSMCRSRCPVPLHGKSQVLAVDTNVLYAADADSQFHTACRDWLERERARPGAWYQLVDPLCA